VLSISLKLRSSRSGDKGLSLKQKAFALREIENREYFEFSLKLAHLSQASPSRSSERPSLKRALKTKGGELLPFSLRRELLA